MPKTSCLLRSPWLKLVRISSSPTMAGHRMIFARSAASWAPHFGTARQRQPYGWRHECGRNAETLSERRSPSIDGAGDAATHRAVPRAKCENRANDHATALKAGNRNSAMSNETGLRNQPNKKDTERLFRHGVEWPVEPPGRRAASTITSLSGRASALIEATKATKACHASWSGGTTTLFSPRSGRRINQRQPPPARSARLAAPTGRARR